MLRELPFYLEIFLVFLIHIIFLLANDLQFYPIRYFTEIFILQLSFVTIAINSRTVSINKFIKNFKFTTWAFFLLIFNFTLNYFRSVLSFACRCKYKFPFSYFIVANCMKIFYLKLCCIWNCIGICFEAKKRFWIFNSITILYICMS